MCSLYFSAKIKVYLLMVSGSQAAGPRTSSKYNFIQLSFRKGGQEEVSDNVLILINN